jgi:hypothetical protein
MRIEVEYYCNLCEKRKTEEIVINSKETTSLVRRCECNSSYMLPMSAKEVRRFFDYLRSGVHLDCDLIIGDVDMPASFVWDENCRITEAGYQKFKSIMDADYEVLENGNIEIFCDDDQLGEKFVYAAAGYVSESNYHDWFEGEWKED